MKNTSCSFIIGNLFDHFLIMRNDCRKELILQYLCGLSSTGMDKDQMVVKEFLQGLGSSSEARDPVEYLKNIQRMKGEWFNQQGKTNKRTSNALCVERLRPEAARRGICSLFERNIHY